MTAQDLLKHKYKGDGILTEVVVAGHRATRPEDMICDCDDDGECCGD